MKHFARVTVGLLALFASIAIAQESVATFKNAKARSAQIRYEKAMADLERDFQKKVLEVRQLYINDLKQAQTEVTRAGNLDEGVLIRDEIKTVESLTRPELPKGAPKAVPAETVARKKETDEPRKVSRNRNEELDTILTRAQDLKKGMANSRWSYPEGELALNEDGSVSSTTEAYKGVHWTVIDGSRIALHMPGNGLQVLAFPSPTTTTMYSFVKVWEARKVP